MTPDKILELYMPMVEFIANVFGENCEVVLHDLRRLDNSIIVIKNNHITGRTLNDTITDFALDIIHKEKHTKKNFICNYRGKTNNGHKRVRASTFFIRDQEDNLIGMLCTNVDITSLINTRKFLDNLIINDGIDETTEQENFSLSINDHVSLMISETLTDFGTEPLRMTMNEKKQTVKQLEQKGIFRLKGVIAEVAKSLEVSEQTVYRYLQELEKR